MSVRRVTWIAGIALACLLEISCGEVYRPVVIPTNTVPPNPANFHAVFGINANVTANPGSVLQIDVSGDTNIGVANMGVNPTHAAITPNNSRVFVTSAGSLFPDGLDVVTAFSPAADSSVGTGLGTPQTFSLPNIGPIDNTTGRPAWFCSYLPDFVTTTQSSVVYVANYGVENDAGCTPNPISTDSVAILNSSTNTITKIAYLPADSHPVALAETPNAQNLYVVNQGNNTVVDLSPTDLSTVATIPIGTTPVWAVSRIDGQRVYVVTQGDGKLYTIHTDTNVADAGQSVGGPGANFVLYDKSRNRVYVTNPTAGAVYVFDATADPPAPLAAIAMNGGANPPCPNGCSPVSVAALPDGSRFYVASYQTAAVCPDTSLGSSVSCVIPTLTVFDAPSLTVKAVTSLLAPSLSLLTSPQYAPAQYAVPEVASCAPAPTYTPASTRFRMFAASAADSSHVYVSLCDAGSIADINTTTSSISVGDNTPDTLVTNLVAPSALCVAASCNGLATITGFSITSNVVTFQAANNFVPGERVAISGLTTGSSLNGLRLTVLGSGLSASQFACAFSSADVAATSDSGTAVPLPPPQSPIFLFTGQ